MERKVRAVLGRLGLVVSVVCSLILALPADLVLGHGTDEGNLPPGPKIVDQGKYPSATMTGAFDVLDEYIEVPPGASTPVHTHSGPVVNVVINGQVARRASGAEQTLTAGESWIDHSDESHQVLNTTGVAAHLCSIFLQPVGSPLTIVAGGANSANLPPGPRVVAQGKIPSVTMSGPFDVVDYVLDAAPGAATPLHTHPGPVINVVVEGQFLRRANGGEQTIETGQSWTDLPTVAHQVLNVTATSARDCAGFLQPVGSPLTTLIQAPSALPKTGENGPLELAGWLAAGVTLTWLGWAIRRKRPLG
jgi:quercetin dioxygenase-like cupin family protein